MSRVARSLALTLVPFSLLAPGAAAQAPVVPAPQASAGERQGTGTEDRAAEARRMFEKAVELQLAAEKTAPPDPQLLRSAAGGYKRVLVLQPGAAAAHYNLGRAQAALGDLDGAAKSFELAASAPGSRRVFYLRQWADFLQEQGRTDPAFEVYEQVVLLEPRLDEVHELVRERYLELRDRDPRRLLGYVWRLVEGGQPKRSVELAVDALESGWRPPYRVELLAAVAASLAQWHESPSEILEAPLLHRLARFQRDPELGRGVAELIELYASPGVYTDPFRWWGDPNDRWVEENRGVARRDAFRAALRAIGDDYRRRGVQEGAAECYRTAIELGPDPDPRALRSLATMYVEQNDLRSLDALATRYADPAGALFQEKNRLYAEGKLDQVLDYHRALGLIYGSLAASGKAGWGSRDRAASALFQLERAYEVAQQLDRDAGPEAAKSTHVDPGLTVLYARGLRETGDVERSAKILAETDRKYKELGDEKSSRLIVEASPKLLGGVERDINPAKVNRPPPLN